MLFTLFLVLCFVALLVVLIVQIVKLIRIKFADKKKTLTSAFLLTVLVLTLIFPLGIIDFHKYEGPNLIIAQYEGSGNCTTTLKIKESNRFVQTSVCFGVDEYKGEYEIFGDTLKLSFNHKSSFGSKVAFGLIQLDTNITTGKIGQIIYYKDSFDNNPLPMEILEYNIK